MELEWSDSSKRLATSSARGNIKSSTTTCDKGNTQSTPFFLDTYDRQFNALYKHITYYKGCKCGSNLYGFDDVQTVTSLTELGYEMLANYFYHYNYSCYQIRKTRWVVHVTRMGTKHSYTTSVTEREGQIPHVGQIPRSCVPFSTGLACLFTGMSVLK